MDNTIPTLPQGCVVGRILHSTGEGPDAGVLADTAVNVGVVEFVPVTAYRKLAADTVVTHSKLTAKLDSHGHLHPQRVVSDNTGTDAEDAIWLPVGTWSVTYKLNNGTLPTHNIVVTEAHTALAPLALFANMGDAPTPGATYVQLTVPLGGQSGQVLVMSDGSLAWADAAGATQPLGVQQVTLTDDLVYTVPVAALDDQVVSVVFTQDGTGGHTVTYGGNAVAVESAAGSQTLVEIWPNGEAVVIGAPVAAGSVAWADVTDKPTSFAPSAHKTSHATGGTDALTPADIGAQPAGSYVPTTRTVAGKALSSDITLTPADVGAATAAQGVKADSASQPGHTQASSTITDLTEAVQDIVGALIVAGTNTTVTYNDAAGTFTINASTGGSTDPEVVRDTIGGALVAGAGIQITVNDAGDTITVTSTAVLPTRQITAGTGLTGGGDLAADRTLAVDFAASGVNSATKAVRADDSRLTDPRTPTTHTHDDRYYTETETDTLLSGKAAAVHSHVVGDLDATGTPSATTYLRGDGAWATPAGGGGADPWAYAVLGADWTCPDTNTYTNIPGMEIPAGLAAGVYEIRGEVLSKGFSSHHWSLNKPSGGDLYTAFKAARGMSETRFTNSPAAGPNGAVEVDNHPNGSWGALALELTATLVVASSTSTAVSVMLRSISGQTHTAMAGSFITWRKIS